MNYAYEANENSDKKTVSGEFAEQILADLISQGYSGNELLSKFKEAQRKFCLTVEKMIAEAKKSAAGESESFDYDDIFGLEGN